MLHTSAPSGQENMVASVYLLATVSAMSFASECAIAVQDDGVGVT